MFALIADEASDVSQKEQLCINLRWVDNDLVILETPVELICVPKTDSSMLYMLTKDCLLQFSLLVSQCREQAYDVASNMSGYIIMVQLLVSQKDEASTLYVHWLAHCTIPCLHAVESRVIPIGDALDLAMDQVIGYLPVHFKSMQAQLSPGAPSLKPLCPTQWTVQMSGIKSILINYEILCDVLHGINQES